MRVLVLGADGMLGHQLVRDLRVHHQVQGTVRRQVDVRDMDRVKSALAEISPEAVINATGIIPQRPQGSNLVESLQVNALFPHLLSRACGDIGARLIHISTDCVFSGERGGYREEDRPDPVDLYGYTKLLGEIYGEGRLTLRTSLVGRGLTHKTGLLDWFLNQHQPVNGYRNAIFSGVTTTELSRVVAKLLGEHPGASGLYHVSAEPISKFDFLVLVRKHFGLSTEIIPTDDPRVDRSLVSSRFRAEFKYVAPPWNAMIEELAKGIEAHSS